MTKRLSLTRTIEPGSAPTGDATTELKQSVAVVHDWLVTFGGAERVLEQILFDLPEASLYALCDFLDSGNRERIQGRHAHTSFIQRLPKARRHYRSYLPFMPYAIEQFDLSDFDTVVSSSHAVAHGVLTHSEQLHICYVNNTMVYAWDLYHHYLRSAGLDRGLKGLVARLVMHYVRAWDAASAPRVDCFVANSKYMSRRLKRLYGVPSEVIYPPVETDAFHICDTKDNYYVTVSRLVPFKRIDLIVDAFTRMPDRKLVVVGDGPEMQNLKRRAGKNIEFTGFCDHDTVHTIVRRARAFIFSSVEPFGIAVVEAQACGTPVIAFAGGAATEIVQPGITGMFFDSQDSESLVDAVRRFHRLAAFDPARMRTNAERFSSQRFRREFTALLERERNRFRAATTGDVIQREAIEIEPEMSMQVQ